MRAGAGDGVAVFNGRDGEWWARIEISNRVRCTVRVVERTRPQAAEPDLWLAFAPIKRAPVDFLARKVTELGVFRLWPVFTRHTAASRQHRPPARQRGRGRRTVPPADGAGGVRTGSPGPVDRPLASRTPTAGSRRDRRRATDRRGAGRPWEGRPAGTVRTAGRSGGRLRPLGA